MDPSLLNFTLINFMTQQVKSVTNNGYSGKPNFHICCPCFWLVCRMCTAKVINLLFFLFIVVVKLAENDVQISGGGLNETYTSVQFHFHWGDTEYHPGSEHTVDGKRYAMEVLQGLVFSINTPYFFTDHIPLSYLLLWSIYRCTLSVWREVSLWSRPWQIQRELLFLGFS